MKTLLPRLFIAAILLSFATPAFCGDAGWGTDYPKALDRAKADNKAVLVYFMSSEDGNCAKVKGETLDTPEFKHYAQKNLVLVEMDFGHHQAGQSASLKEQNDNLGQKLGIGGFPTFVVMDSTGKVLGQVGYIAGGPEPFIARLKTIYKPSANGSNGSNGSGGSGGSTGASGGSGDFDSFFKKR